MEAFGAFEEARARGKGYSTLMDFSGAWSELDSLFPLFVIFGFFTIPIVAILLFMFVRARLRRARLRGPWTALAQRLGGQFHEGGGLAGSAIQALRPTYRVSVRTTLASVMDARVKPYYLDGGTYTEVIVDLPAHSPAHYVSPYARTQLFTDPSRVPALSHLGSNARIFVDPKTARIVWPGAIDDYAKLAASAQALEELTHLVMTTGPMPAAA